MDMITRKGMQTHHREGNAGVYSSDQLLGSRHPFFSSTMQEVGFWIAVASGCIGVAVLPFLG